jgi:predicted DNA-binding transcriptional regulator YafY
MLRDLHALSRTGVPLRSTPGPGGGYSLPRGGRRLGETDGQRSGIVEAEIPRSEIDFYASRLPSVGTDVKVESPPELAEAISNKARDSQPLRLSLRAHRIVWHPSDRVQQPE